MNEIEKCLEEKFNSFEKKIKTKAIKEESKLNEDQEITPNKSPLKTEEEFELERINTNADSNSKMNGNNKKRTRKGRMFLDFILKKKIKKNNISEI